MARVKDFTYNMASNQQLVIHRVGQLIRCTNAAEAFTVQIDDGEELTLQEGIGVRFVEPFQRCRIINGDNSQQITVYVGDDEVDDSRQYGNITAALVSFGNLQDSPDVELATGVPTLLVAADADRSAVHVTNLSPSANIRIGSENVGASRGVLLGPGLTFTLNNYDGALYAFQNSGAAVDVSILEIKQ